MRFFLLLLLYILYGSPSFAAIKTAINNGGQGWGTATNWLPAGIPDDGDVVIIPVGFTMSVKGSLYTGNTNLIIMVHGTVQFEPSGKLNLGRGSSVQLIDAIAKITTSNSTGSELIDINGIAKYRGGTDGTLIGPAFASASTGLSPLGFATGVLPVHLQSFTANKQHDQVVLQWQIATNDPAHHFVVERSANGSVWQPILEVQVIDNMVQYAITDKSPLPGTNYYRLKMVETNGAISYSSTVQAVLSQANSLRIHQESGHGVLKVFLPSSLMFPLRVQVVNAGGQVIMQRRYLANTPIITMDLQGYSKGNYFLHLQNGSSKQGMVFQLL